MIVVFAAATNLRLLRAWARRTLGTDDLIPLIQPSVSPAERSGIPKEIRDAGPPVS
jgi:hypothetical protein